MPEQSFGATPVVLIDGTRMVDDLAALVVELVIDTSLHQPDLVQVTLQDPGHDVFRRLGLRIGSRCTVSATKVGDGTQTELVQAEITTLERDLGPAGSFAIFRGYDLSHRLGRGRRTATYNDVTDADVVRQLAARAGIAVGQVDTSPTTHEHLAQVNQTDWDFLTARAHETGHDVCVRDGALQWTRPARSADAPEPSIAMDDSALPLQLKVGSTLLSFRPRVTAGSQVGRVVVRGWDATTKRAVVGRADAAGVAAEVGIGPAELGGAFGATEDVSVTTPVATQSEADAMAEALVERVASVHAEAEGTATGDPRLRAGAAISVGHAGWPFDGRYTLTSARHVYDQSGYRTHLGVSGRQDRSLLGLTSGSGASDRTGGGGLQANGVVPGVVPAVVTDVNDPDEVCRVKLSLPWLADDYESSWVRTTQLGAGLDRGAVWLPEVGDEVLVAFEHGDVRRPYVIGSLHNGVDTPRLGDRLVDGGTGAVRRRGFVSRLGHRLVFLDDDAQSGVALLSGDDALRISLKQSDATLAISADGSVSITGSREVTVSSDGAITLDSGSTLTLKGRGGVTVDGGPKVAVTGNLITLN